MNYNKIALLFSIVTFFLASCLNEEFNTDSSAKLEFSTDTVLFDTVFTGIGSSTKRFKVYNRHNKYLKISEIKLAKGNQSCYRLNIDGRAVDNIQNYELPPKDSIYIFVEVTINPSANDMLEQDSIVFLTNNNIQDVDLVAFGQNIVLLKSQVLTTQTFTKDKPYLLYNWALVDTLQTLTIEAGTHIYCHRDSRFAVQGSLKINGTLEEPVIFEGDRLEHMYFDVPGQWGGIWFVQGSYDNEINYAEIKNAIIGIQIDTTINANQPTLFIRNSKIEHHSYAGIYAQATMLIATNCLIADCGTYAAAFVLGGHYELYHCTIANYWTNTIRNSPSLVFNNYLNYNNNKYFWGNLSAYIGNCIIYGDKKDEFYADAYPIENSMGFMFNNCLMKLSTDNYSYSIPSLNTSIFNQNPKFKSIQKYDYQLDTLSPAKDMAKRSIIELSPTLLQFDIKGVNRLLDSNPDIGVYERVE